MYPQITRYRGCIIALAAFVWLFSAVHFKMCPWMACMWGGKVTLIAFVLLWIFKCFLKRQACEHAVTFVICQSPRQPLCFLFVHFKIQCFSQIFPTQVACFQRYIRWIFRLLLSDRNVQKIHHVKTFVQYKIPGFSQLFATQVACFQLYVYHVSLHITLKW